MKNRYGSLKVCQFPQRPRDANAALQAPTQRSCFDEFHCYPRISFRQLIAAP